MHIIALGWIYVVLMMAITESSIIAGIMTFTFYCAIPLGLVWYLTSRKKPKIDKSQEQHNSDLKRQQHDSSKPCEKLETKN
ncbi:hypothetical protein [Solimicrobium silvestre]|uniref:Uncharacterized protein n=1 Tax=Solimicrobium silvestre TaxID=2099400 RepID=A0A2S9GVA4_9BURK|nr:hypothetical protein [Solimicrobium silvestre]PRC91640.1 hypothetical protein S2091_3578 [Solimicrobium silvestre]